MILVEAEPPLPSIVQDAKVKVLAAFQTMHALREFASVKELTDFLDDEVLDGLVAAGCPRMLSRVVMFARSDRAIQEVAKRMAPGAAFYVWKSPTCWLALHRGHGSQLRDWAKRAEPNWQGDLPQGLMR